MLGLGWLGVQAGLAQQQGLSATVLSIGDGDTIRVRQSGRAVTVRLACIDAPETAQSPYGQQARAYLQQRLPIGREVSLEVKTIDRYGRTVAHLLGCLAFGFFPLAAAQFVQGGFVGAYAGVAADQL